MSAKSWRSAAETEATWPGVTLRLGDRSPSVRRLQEWLQLGGCEPGKLDGSFGARTAAAVRRLQASCSLPETGEADEATLRAACAPLVAAFSPLAAAAGAPLGEAAWAVAERHLAAGPREVGGANCGPWVRAYMGGREGSPYPWCAGFASTVVRQAAESLGVAPPFALSVGCDEIARAARAAGRLVAADRAAPWRGAAVLLLRGERAGDWVHAGLARRRPDGSLDTIEGNTNEEGGREGVAARARVRRAAGADLALLDAP